MQPGLSPIRADEFKSRAIKEYLAWCDVMGYAANPDANEDNLADLFRPDELETRKDGNHA